MIIPHGCYNDNKKDYKKMKYLIYPIIVFIIGACNPSEQETPIDEPIQIDTIQNIAEQVELVYGIDPEEYEIKKSKVKYGETLAKLLYGSGVSSSKVNTLINLSENVFDSRKIKFGNSYTRFYGGAEKSTPQFFVYEIDKMEYLRFALNDSLYVDRIQKQTDTLRTLSSFSIKNSLWMTMKDLNLDPMLALELSEIYAWSIDFFGLQEGDSVKVAYDEIYVDGERAGIHKIYAAYFRHIGHDYYAVYHDNEGNNSYFDLEGNSLRKAFLKAPLSFSRISSRFSNSRLHPILKIRRPHHGVDYAAAIGTPVHAIGDGIVQSVTYTKGAGRMVKLKHNSVYKSAYMHLSRYGKGIKPGVHVTQGQIIGYVGSSGLSTGPHLDFRMYMNNQPVDPLKIESPPVEPIAKNLMPLYRESVFLALELLEIEQTYLASNTLKPTTKKLLP